MKKLNLSVDWKRINKSLLQNNRKLKQEDIDEVFCKFSAIQGLLGEYSLGRTTVTKICAHILKNKQINCIVPVCPDYSEDNELYTLNNLSGGISMLARKHIDFLKKIQECVPVKAHILYADYEAEDDYLRSKVGVTKEEFFAHISSSKETCISLVKNFGWTASLMTELIPDIAQQESVYIELIRNEEKYKGKIEYDTFNKSELFNRINPNFTWEDKIFRTLKYSAQYYVMGLFCSNNDYLVCNHSTANLSWYLKTGTGLLHNPISIY
jgi:hypothetical protein